MGDAVNGFFENVGITMAFIQPCFIRKNTPELRQELEKLGYSVCECTSFKDSVWLDTATHTIPCSSHGIGFWDETCDCEDVEGACRIFLEENKKSLNPKIDCGTNEEMFLALAALRDDTDRNQWFVDDVAGVWERCESELPSKHMQLNGHKATAEEIVEHFKDKQP